MLSPLGARALLGLPSSALADIADLADVVPAMADLPERLAAGRSWPQRRALECSLLTGLARHGEHANSRELRATLVVLSGTTRVQEAAQLLKVSPGGT